VVRVQVGGVREGEGGEEGRGEVGGGRGGGEVGGQQHTHGNT
jgi:hypothetical protein